MPDLPTALAAAVAAVGGTERPGQVEMATAVTQAFTTGEHLLVQAGTGTGKSLAYLVPAILYDDPVVIATATIALQRQLIERDLPRLVEALEPLGLTPQFAILKGRQNYLCRHRLEVGVPDEDLPPLFDDAPTSPVGADVVRIRAWAEDSETGDRDELVPAPLPQAWRTLSVSSRECLGQKCQFLAECFAEQARERARDADIVVTNHALLAIDALEGIPVLPAREVVIIDEGHELVDRATGAVTEDLTALAIERAARGARSHADSMLAKEFEDAGLTVMGVLEAQPVGRIESIDGELLTALMAFRDTGHAVISAFPAAAADGEGDAGRKVARAAVESLHAVAGRVIAAGDHDVVWVEQREWSGRTSVTLKVAPLSVAGLLRESLFADQTVVVTSATLQLGGSFDAVARSYGLGAENAPRFTTLDVGSPFDYPHQGILYIAERLPAPGRDGASPEAATELVELIVAAGGRTLGLFSSQRAAEAATALVRERLPELPVLCQGEDATHELVRHFAADAATSLFGTLSLWQGVDVPGPSCSLVVVDRIPFPRPDDPLASARARAVERAGGNGFMAVSAAQAALLLAQGAGRLIRSMEDRGVVAVLDSRLATARYGAFLTRSLPPFWRTHDPQVARAALVRLRSEAQERA